MTTYTLEDRIAMLEDAQEKIAEAVDLLKAATSGDEGLRRTMIAGLEILIEAGGWMSRDTTIPQLISSLNAEANAIEDCPNCGAPVVTEDSGTRYPWQHCMACDWSQDL